MGIFRRAKDHGPPPTEHTATEPGADCALHGTSRAAGDASSTTLTERGGDLAVGSKVIGPNVPVAGVVSGDDGRTDVSTTSTSRGTESTTIERKTPVQSDGHVTGAEKVEENDEKKVDGEEEVEDESKYPKGIPLAILTFGLCMATFVVSKLW